MPRADPLAPHSSRQAPSIRKVYIQNLTDLLHVCLLRGDLDRARRAWAILIRCREVDWRSRWYWGLAILNASASEGTEPSQSSAEAERWLKQLRVSAKEAEKPALLHALVLQYIKHGQYRAALDELETYLTSYPYLLSGPLHTYAGLLAFYLAQPAPSRNEAPSELSGRPPLAPSDMASSSSRSASPILQSTAASFELPDATLLRQSRAWFVKALQIDTKEGVASEFIRIIDDPQQASSLRGSVSGNDDDDERMSREGKDDEDESESPSSGDASGADDSGDSEVSNDQGPDT